MSGGWNKMMKQMQKMQEQIVNLQNELAEREVEATSGGGAVKAVANGKKELVSLKISPDLLEEASEDAEMLEDMVIAAVNEVMKKVDEMTSEEMQKITGGMNLPPGLF